MDSTSPAVIVAVVVDGFSVIVDVGEEVDTSSVLMAAVVAAVVSLVTPLSVVLPRRLVLDGLVLSILVSSSFSF